MARSMTFPFVAAVVGVSYYQDDVRKVSEGMRALVEHEPSNPYDRNACRVTVHGTLLGYLPRSLALRLTSSGEDTAWDAEVSEVLVGENWGLRIKVTGPVALGPGPETISPSEPSQADRKVVRAKSGRRLGLLVSRDARQVVVESDKGTRVPYPASLVRVD